MESGITTYSPELAAVEVIFARGLNPSPDFRRLYVADAPSNRRGRSRAFPWPLLRVSSSRDFVVAPVKRQE